MQTHRRPDPAAARGRPRRARATAGAEQLGKRFARLRAELRGDRRRASSGASASSRTASGRCSSRSSPPDQLRRVAARVLRRGGVPLAARPALASRSATARPVHARRRARRVDRLRAGRVHDRRCSAATRTGAARSGCRSTTSRSASSCSYHGSSATSSPSSTRPAPDTQRTLGEIAQDLADRLVVDLAARRRRAPARLRRDRAVADRPGLAGHPDASTSTSTATTAPGSAPRTRPAGRRSSPT